MLAGESAVRHLSHLRASVRYMYNMYMHMYMHMHMYMYM